MWIKKIRSAVKKKKRNRKRKIIWLNSTFCKLGNINIGKYFLKLMNKHFNQNNILHKIFYTETLKISYSCTKNVFEIINNHNKEIIRKYHDRRNGNNDNNNSKRNNININNTSRDNECNYKTKNNCTMNGYCTLENAEYQGSFSWKKTFKVEKLTQVSHRWNGS